MNYKHAYHAGNFADVVKHILLVQLLNQLSQKNKPFLGNPQFFFLVTILNVKHSIFIIR